MTEHSPSVEIVLSSDLFDDDPSLESLSVQATAILDAYMAGYGWLDSPTKKDCRGLAAALRAAAGQVISPVSPPCGDIDEYAQGFLAAHIKYRDAFLAIASELEAQ